MQPDHNINWALCLSTIIIAEPLNVTQHFPLSHDTRFVQGPITGISIPCFNLVTDEPCLLVPCNCDLVSPSRTCRVMVTIPPSGPQSIYPSHGRTNPAIDQSHQPTPFRHPRYTFMIALLRCDGWCSQSTLLVVVIKKRSHSLTERLLRFIIMVM